MSNIITINQKLDRLWKLLFVMINGLVKDNDLGIVVKDNSI